VTTALEIILSLIPPTLLLISGWLVYERFWPHEPTLGKTLKLLHIVLVGTACFVIPYLVFGVAFGLLHAFVVAHALIALVGLVLARNRIVAGFPRLVRSLGRMIRNGSPLMRFSCLCFIMYSVKSVFTCLMGPIISGDALYLWLSMGKVFFRLDYIPSFDPYHLWKYTAEPASSILFSWGYFFVGSTDLEVFRGIQAVYFLAIPLLAWEAARVWGGSEQSSQVALILTCFIPIMDQMVFTYSFYADPIAVFFAILSVILARVTIQNQSPFMGLLCGLSLSLTLMSKYGLGLLAVVGVAIQMLSLLGYSSRTRILQLAITGVVVALMVVLGNMLWSFLLNPIALVVLVPIALVFLWIRFNDTVEVAYHIRLELKIVGALAVGVGTSMIWGLRALLQGGGLFGVSFLRILPLSPDYVAVAELLNQIFPLSTADERFSILIPVGFVFHPLTNGIFSIVAFVLLVRAFRDRTALPALWNLLFWYLGYVIILGYMPSGRHMLACGVILASAVGVASSTYSNQSSRLFRVGTWTLVYMFAATSFLQMATVGLVIGDLGLTGNWLVSAATVSPGVPFGLSSSPDLVLRMGILAVLAAVCTLILPVIWRYISRARFKGAQTSLILSLVISSAVLLPVVVHAMDVSAGDLFSYDYRGSWNQGDILLADYLGGVVSPDDIILAYGDVMLSYAGFRVVDLYHAGLYMMPSLLESTNVSEISQVLLSLGVRIMVLPDNESYLYAGYSRFISCVPFPEIIAESESAMLITHEYGWRVYQLLPV